MRVCIAPKPFPELAQAVTRANGTLVPADQAQALVWTDASDPQGLKTLLSTCPARWVQLPFAGIEGFFAAGAIDPARTWTCAKGIYGVTCAEHALVLMLAATRHLKHHFAQKAWRPRHLPAPESRLKGSTILIVGTGGIGGALMRLLGPFDAKVLTVNRRNVERLPELVTEADFVVLTPALTPSTRHMVDEKLLARFKPGAWLVNVARGGLVDTDALVAALKAGRLGGAALDVTEPEPLPQGHPLWDLPNVLITPHIANTWEMALPELAELIARNLSHFHAGEPLEGLVSPQLGY